MLSAGDRVGVAVSGGADSMALLRLLETLRNELGITLLVVHFDHMLRGAESDADAAFVAEVARASGLELVSAREDVRGAAEQYGWNLEDSARRLRYAFFDRVLNDGKATHIAIAHTADDQAETVLAHVIRGTGLTGLAGIYPLMNSPGGGTLVRPLLSTSGRELREYLRERGQAWREDLTNLDQRRLRARIRAQLLPVLERDFSPASVSHLGELARFAREDELFWNAIVEDRLAEFTTGGVADQSLTIRAASLLAPLSFRAATERSSPACGVEATRALTERMVRRLYEKLRGDRCDLSARHVEQVIHLAAESSSGKRLELPGNIQVERVFDKLVFSQVCGVEHPSPGGETKIHSATYHYVVTLPTRGAAVIPVPELATRFRLKLVDWPLAESDTKTDGEALDAAAIRTPLILRNWQPGDAYRPRGHRQIQKLKQMFLAGRIPSDQRASWPVLESAGQVIWARGMAAADEFCVRQNDDGRRSDRRRHALASDLVDARKRPGSCIRRLRRRI